MGKYKKRILALLSLLTCAMGGVSTSATQVSTSQESENLQSDEENFGDEEANAEDEAEDEDDENIDTEASEEDIEESEKKGLSTGTKVVGGVLGVGGLAGMAYTLATKLSGKDITQEEFNKLGTMLTNDNSTTSPVTILETDEIAGSKGKFKYAMKFTNGNIFVYTAKGTALICGMKSVGGNASSEFKIRKLNKFANYNGGELTQEQIAELNGGSLDAPAEASGDNNTGGAQGGGVPGLGNLSNQGVPPFIGGGSFLHGPRLGGPGIQIKDSNTLQKQDAALDLIKELKSKNKKFLVKSGVGENANVVITNVGNLIDEDENASNYFVVSENNAFLYRVTGKENKNESSNKTVVDLQASTLGSEQGEQTQKTEEQYNIKIVPLESDLCGSVINLLKKYKNDKNKAENENKDKDVTLGSQAVAEHKEENNEQPEWLKDLNSKLIEDIENVDGSDMKFDILCKCGISQDLIVDEQMKCGQNAVEKYRNDILGLSSNFNILKEQIKDLSNDLQKLEGILEIDTTNEGIAKYIADTGEDAASNLKFSKFMRKYASEFLHKYSEHNEKNPISIKSFLGAPHANSNFNVKSSKILSKSAEGNEDNDTNVKTIEQLAAGYVNNGGKFSVRFAVDFVQSRIAKLKNQLQKIENTKQQKEKSKGLIINRLEQIKNDYNNKVEIIKGKVNSTKNRITSQHDELQKTLDNKFGKKGSKIVLSLDLSKSGVNKTEGSKPKISINDYEDGIWGSMEQYDLQSGGNYRYIFIQHLINALNTLEGDDVVESFLGNDFILNLLKKARLELKVKSKSDAMSILDNYLTTAKQGIKSEEYDNDNKDFGEKLDCLFNVVKKQLEIDSDENLLDKNNIRLKQYGQIGEKLNQAIKEMQSPYFVTTNKMQFLPQVFTSTPNTKKPFEMSTEVTLKIPGDTSAYKSSHYVRRNQKKRGEPTIISFNSNPKMGGLKENYNQTASHRIEEIISTSKNTTKSQQSETDVTQTVGRSRRLTMSGQEHDKESPVVKVLTGYGRNLFQLSNKEGVLDEILPPLNNDPKSKEYRRNLQLNITGGISVENLKKELGIDIKFFQYVRAQAKSLFMVYHNGKSWQLLVGQRFHNKRLLYNFQRLNLTECPYVLNKLKEAFNIKLEDDDRGKVYFTHNNDDTKLPYSKETKI